MLLTLLTLSLATQEAPAAAPAAEPAKPKLICRSEVDTGTRVNRRRICATKAQWEARRQEQIDAMALDRSRAERSGVCTSIPCN